MTILLALIGGALLAVGLAVVGAQADDIDWADFREPTGATVAVALLGGVALIALGAVHGLA